MWLGRHIRKNFLHHKRKLWKSSGQASTLNDKLNLYWKIVYLVEPAWWCLLLKTVERLTQTFMENQIILLMIILIHILHVSRKVSGSSPPVNVEELKNQSVDASTFANNRPRFCVNIHYFIIWMYSFSHLNSWQFYNPLKEALWESINVAFAIFLFFLFGLYIRIYFVLIYPDYYICSTIIKFFKIIPVVCLKFLLGNLKFASQ